MHFTMIYAPVVSQKTQNMLQSNILHDCVKDCKWFNQQYITIIYVSIH